MTEFYLLISSFNCLLLFIIITRNCHLLLLLIHINDEKVFLFAFMGIYDLLWSTLNAVYRKILLCKKYQQLSDVTKRALDFKPLCTFIIAFKCNFLSLALLIYISSRFRPSTRMEAAEHVTRKTVSAAVMNEKLVSVSLPFPIFITTK